MRRQRWVAWRTYRDMSAGQEPAEVESAKLRFERLYARHGRAVLAYALRRTTTDDAADAVAETFLVAWRRLDDVPVDDARLWLYGAARRVLANQQRSERRRQRLGERLRQELPAVLGSMAPLEPQTSGVRAALAQLGAEDREVLRLSAWEELTPAEIATVLGVSPVAVRSRLHRARRRLRHALAHESGREPARPDPTCLEEAR